MGSQADIASPIRLWTTAWEPTCWTMTPGRLVTLSHHINKNLFFVVSWPPSVNTEVHPATPCMPPPATFLHSTVVKAQWPGFGSFCAVDTVGVQSGGGEWDTDVLLRRATAAPMFYWHTNKRKDCKQDCFEPDMLSSVDQCVFVCCGQVCARMMMTLAQRSSHFSVSRNPTPVYSPRISQSPWHWEALYTSAFVNKVFSVEGQWQTAV